MSVDDTPLVHHRRWWFRRAGARTWRSWWIPRHVPRGASRVRQLHPFHHTIRDYDWSLHVQISQQRRRIQCYYTTAELPESTNRGTLRETSKQQALQGWLHGWRNRGASRYFALICSSNNIITIKENLMSVSISIQTSFSDGWRFSSCSVAAYLAARTMASFFGSRFATIKFSGIPREHVSAQPSLQYHCRLPMRLAGNKLEGEFHNSILFVRRPITEHP